MKDITVKKFKGFQNNGIQNINLTIDMYSNGTGILGVESNDEDSVFFLELEIIEIELNDTNYSFWRDHINYYSLEDRKFFKLVEIDIINKTSEIQDFLKHFTKYFGNYEVVYSESKSLMFGYYSFYKDNLIYMKQQNINYSDSFQFN